VQGDSHSERYVPPFELTGAVSDTHPRLKALSMRARRTVSCSTQDQLKSTSRTSGAIAEGEVRFGRPRA